MRGLSACYDELRGYCETVPLIDCHDHSGRCGPQHPDPILAVVAGYFRSDLVSASSDEDVLFLEDTGRSLEERWPVLEKAWKRTCYTGYAEVTKRTLAKFYGEEALTLDALRRMQGKLLDTSDPQVFDRILEEANIAARLEDIYTGHEDHDAKAVLDGTFELPPRSRLTISLLGYHAIRSYEEVRALIAPLGRRVTSLDEYLEACREIFQGCKAFGAVACKDQSAYNRAIDYGNPTRAQAEEIFNWLVADPRRSASYPDGIKPLDDYLFHAFMRMARDMDLPVQIHTGHMAGVRNDIVKTNAIGLTSLLELHQDVRFDLFHANWPYSGEILFLAKNYPNVAIDFCWANIIDPYYCQEMFKQALTSVPHGKIHGYGSDFGGGAVERAWAHAQIARDNIAIALSDMVEMEYLDLDEAREIAYAWLFGNANEFFRLGL